MDKLKRKIYYKCTSDNSRATIFLSRLQIPLPTFNKINYQFKIKVFFVVCSFQQLSAVESAVNPTSVHPTSPQRQTQAPKSAFFATSSERQ